MSHSFGKTESDIEQPENFSFSEENEALIKKILARYPEGRQQSAVMPLLTLAQKQHDNWLPVAAMDEIARLLSMPPIKVYEVATFYTMYNVRPVGRHHVQLCTNLPCWLRGSDAIVAACEQHLLVTLGNTTLDGEFTLSEAECLGACVNAPMMEVTTDEWDEYYEDLSPENVVELLEAMHRGQKPKPGPQSGRHSSEPAGGATTLGDKRKGAA